MIPIGPVVLLGDSIKKVMIVGVCQKDGGGEPRLWDYTGVVIPEGYLDASEMFLLNNEQISYIYALGYQNGEQLAFRQETDVMMKELRK